MKVSEGSHLFLISSHFSNAESVMTYKFVNYHNSGGFHEMLQSVAYGGLIPW